jgi:putative membrane protein
MRREVAKDVIDDKFDSKAEEKIAQFVVEEVSANYAAIEMSKLVVDHSDNNELKQLAVRLVKDHTMFLNGLTRLAADKQITVPTEPGEAARNEIKQLSEITTKGFDKPWCDRMMVEHQRMISKFEKAATTLTDTGLKDWVNKVLPLLREHLDKLMLIHYEV